MENDDSEASSIKDKIMPMVKTPARKARSRCENLRMSPAIKLKTADIGLPHSGVFTPSHLQTQTQVSRLSAFTSAQVKSEEDTAQETRMETRLSY